MPQWFVLKSMPFVYGIQILNLLALLGGQLADGNKVLGNFIGVDAKATTSVPNQGGGVFISGGTNNTAIGNDSAAGEENIISGNTGAGVKIDGAAKGVTLVKNYIGTGVDPTNKAVKLPNTKFGIDLSTLDKAAPPVIIEKPNVIGNQGKNNIYDPNKKAKDNGATTFAAADLGIDIDAPGVTLTGMPVITSIMRNDANIQLTGTLASTPNSTFDLYFYSNTQPNPSGYGEGETLIGSTTVTTDGNGNASFALTFTPSSLPASLVDYVSAIATDDSADGTSSEYSRVARAYDPGTIGGEVWNDFNTNGILDPYEAGLSGVTVNLLNASDGSLVASTTTDTNGYYEFDNQAAGMYYVQFVAPSAYQFSPANAGPDSTTNSLADPTTGDTPTFTLTTDSIVADVNAGLSQTRPAPSITVMTDTNPSVYGQDVTFTAIVSAASGTPNGTVTFLDGSTPIGSSPLDSTGTATLDVSLLAIGNHSIQAVYNGDANDAPATSAAISQQVNQDASTVTLVSSASPSSLGQAVTFTAVVAAASPGSGLPTGSVTFYDGSTVLETTTLDDTGTAVFSSSSLELGTHNLSAVYSGDSNFQGSTGTLTQQVNQATSTNLTDSSGPVVVGQSFILTAVVSASSGTPTGTVSFIADGLQDLGDVALDDSGTATLSTSLLTVGSHNIEAVYNGDSDYGISTSNTVVQQVNQASTTTTIASSGSPSMLGQSVTLVASVSVNSPGNGIPTGTVTFMDGDTELGTAPLDGNGNATLPISTLAAGSHDITAIYSGDDNFTGSSGSLTQVISQEMSSSVSLSSSANPALANQEVTFTATVSGDSGTPAGTVTFMDGDTELDTATLDSNGNATITTSALTPGSHTITAIYNGDATYANSDAMLTQTVDYAASSTSLSSDASSGAQPGQNVTFTATVSGNNGTPTGSVTFLDGDTVLDTVALDANGNATLPTSALASGNHDITALYSGDATYSSSAASLTQTVFFSGTLSGTVGGTTSGGGGLNFNGTIGGDLSGTFSGTHTGTGDTFTGGGTLGDGTPYSVSGTYVYSTGDNNTFSGTFSGSGTTNDGRSVSVSGPFSGTYDADDNLSGTFSGTISVGVNAVNATVSLSSSANPSYAGQAVTLTATVSGDSGTPTGSVTFYDGDTVLGTEPLDANGIATLVTTMLSLDSQAITAIYSGDSTYSAGTATLTQQVVQAASTTSLTADVNPSPLGDTVTFTATVAAVNPNAGTPTGTVSFYDGTTFLGTGTLSSVDGQMQATFATDALGLGSHTIVAIYSGDSTFADSGASLQEEIS